MYIRSCGILTRCGIETAPAKFRYLVVSKNSLRKSEEYVSESIQDDHTPVVDLDY